MSNKELKRGLNNRHLQMIALGGAIGTGLFYGSAATIQLAGPAISLAYLIGGTVIFLIMRMLGEMTVDEPVSGSFSHYANKYCHPMVGFISGWNYWINYVIVSMVELTAIGIYVNYWYPDIPQYLSALICIILISAINLLNVRLYGEFEFITAIIKIIAIICMIIFGLYIIFTQMGSFPDNLSNLYSHGGYLPNGLHGLFLSLVIVMFSFGGIELIGITAGEASEPKKTIPRAINQVIVRILIFYVATLVILMILYPWNEVGTKASPFVQIFDNIGIPAAANLLNIVVLTAALSVYNSAIYSNSRMLYGLAAQKNAPKFLGKLNSAGAPITSILVSSGITLIAVLLNYLYPETVFYYLISLAVASVIISWLIIVVTHIRFRKIKDKDNTYQTNFKAILYPYINYLVIGFLIFLLVMMTQIPDMSVSVLVLPIWVIFLMVIYKIRQVKIK